MYRNIWIGLGWKIAIGYVDEKDLSTYFVRGLASPNCVGGTLYEHIEDLVDTEIGKLDSNSTSAEEMAKILADRAWMLIDYDVERLSSDGRSELQSMTQWLPEPYSFDILDDLDKYCRENKWTLKIEPRTLSDESGWGLLTVDAGNFGGFSTKIKDGVPGLLPALHSLISAIGNLLPGYIITNEEW